jgi:hypothetical protein
VVSPIPIAIRTMSNGSMSLLTKSGIFSAAAAAVYLFVLPQTASAQFAYVGDAAAVKANVLGIINASISATGSLPSTGGELAVSLLDFRVPPTLDLHLLTANTAGENGQTNSQAAIANLTLNVAGIYITASVLDTNANAACYPDHAEVSGGSTIVALKVNGLSVRVTGNPNQTIPLLIGSLIINEQVSKLTSPPDLITADMVVNALHLKVDLLADVVISNSHAGMVCANLIPQ